MSTGKPIHELRAELRLMVERHQLLTDFPHYACDAVPELLDALDERDRLLKDTATALGIACQTIAGTVAGEAGVARLAADITPRIAAALGPNSTASAKEGAIVLSEWDDDRNLIGVAAFMVGQDGIEAGKTYRLVGGKPEIVA